MKIPLFDLMSFILITKNIKNNLLFFTISRGLRFVHLSFLIILIGRRLGVEPLGLYSLATFYAIFIGIFVDFGLKRFLTREVARNGVSSKELIEVSLFIKTSALLFFIPFIGCILYLIKYDFLDGVIIILICLSYSILSLNETLYTFFQGEQRFEMESIIVFLETILIIAFSYIMIMIESLSILSLAIMLIIVRIFSLSSSLFIYGYKDMRFLCTLSKIRTLLSASFPFWITDIFGVLYMQSGILVLSILMDKYAIGIYSAAINIAFMVVMTGELTSTAIYPVFSRLYPQDINQANRLAVTAIRYHIGLALLFAFFLYFMAEGLITLLFDEKFAPAVPHLRLLSIYTIPGIMTYLFGSMMLAKDLQSKKMFYMILCTFIIISLNILFIPYYGVKGAVISSILTEFVMLMLYFNSLKIGILSLFIKGAV